MKVSVPLADAGQRLRAVTGFDCDIVVEAGAGSGKTSLLVERLLQALLIEGAALRRIAAITFTKKAAAEMQDRLAEDLARIGAIQAGREAPDAATAAGRLWQRIAGDPERTEQAAARAAAALRHLDDAVITTVHAFCGALLRRHPLASGLAPGFREDDGAGLDQVLQDEGPAAVSVALASLPQPTRAALAEHHAGKRLLEAAAEAARVEPAPAATDKVDRFDALAALAQEAGRELRARLGRRGWVGFSDVILGARELLRHHAGIRDRERARWDHLLVDELQDTDPHQYGLLLALTREPPAAGPRPRLFLVGDPKQSIYRFRGADLQAYHEFQQAVLADGEKLVLDTNFRSRSALLAPLNQLFERVMVPQEGVQPAYESIKPAPGLVDPAAQPPRIRLLEVRTEGSTDDRRTGESVVIAAELRRLHEERQIEWRDMLVLLPKFTGLPQLQRAFQAAGIPYTVAGGKSFFKRQEVADFAALMTAVLGREAAGAADWQAALLACLRSALGAATDLELFRYAQLVPDGEGFGAPPAPGADCPRVASFLERLAGWQAQLAAHPADEWPARLLECSGLRALWALRPVGPQAVANLDKAVQIVGDRVRELGMPLPAAVRRLADQLNQGEDPEQPVSEEDADAVGILTVHKAKGLERRVVVIGAFDGGAAGATKGFQLWTREDRGVAIQLAKDDASPLFLDLLQEQRAHERAERLRLLYVAATRAREELLLVQSLQEPRALRDNLWLEALEQGWGYRPTPPGAEPTDPRIPGVTFEFVEPQASGTAGGRTAGVSTADAAAAVAAWEAELPAAVPLFGTPSRLGHGGAELEEERPGEDEADAGALPRAAGVLVHALLELCPLDALERLAEPLPRLLPAAAHDHGVREAELAERVRALLTGIPQSECGRQLARIAALPHQRELPLLLAEEGRTFAGSADLVYQDGERGWIVADYKTDHGVTPADAVARYAAQLGLYARALQQALGLPEPPRMELFLLQPGTVAEVPRAAAEAR